MFSATIISYLQLRQRAFLHRTNMPKKQFQMVKLLPKKVESWTKKSFTRLSRGLIHEPHVQIMSFRKMVIGDVMINIDIQAISVMFR